MNERKKTYLKILVNSLLMVLFAVLFIIFVPKLLRFFMPFVIAFFISAIANPMVRFLEKKVKIVRKHSSAIIIVLVLGAVVGLLYLLIRFLSDQVMNLYEDRFLIYEEIKMVFDDFANNIEHLLDKLPADSRVSLNDLQMAMTEWIEGFLAGIELPSIATAGTYVSNVVEAVFMVIITILAAYFLTAERDNIGKALGRILPKQAVEYYNVVVDSFKKAVGGYFKAQFKIMLILMAIMLIGFALMRINYALLLSALIAFLDFLPIFGTGAVFWPWILIDVIAGNYRRAILLGILYLVCQLVKQLLQPKMVGDSVGMNPLAALLYMFIGYRIAGIFGMIIGIPVGMIIVSLYKVGMFDRFIKGIKILANDINEFRKF